MSRQQCTKTWCETDGSKSNRCWHNHDEHTFFYWGRCKSGKHWFWRVYRFGNRSRGETEWSTGEWYGWDDAEEGARQAAMDKIKAEAGSYPVSLFTSHGSASSKLREVSQARRKSRMAANPSPAKGVSNHGTLWVYDMRSEESDFWGWEEYRIIKVTKKYVWVESWRTRDRQDGRLTRIDRETLERDGSAWGGTNRGLGREHYYTEAGMKAEEMEKLQRHADWLKHRFAPLPEMPEEFSRDDVMKAFREASLAHHPDQGGDPEMFRKLVEAKESALRVRAEIDAARDKARARQETAEARP